MKLRTDEKIQQLVDSYGDWWNKGFEIPTMSRNLYPYNKMFEPIRVNNVTIKNRLIMAPMGNISMCEETGRPNAKMLKYFEERAKGGVGLITSGLIPISYGVDKSLIELGELSYFPRIDRSRTVYAGWRDLAVMCHSQGAKFFIQLTAGLGRVGNPQCLVTQHKFPRSASWNPNWYIPQIPCKRLTGGELRKIIKGAGQGAADAKAAQIDGVYLHGHEGYLLEQLTNKAFNRRVLGKYSDYQRFGIDMVKEIRKRVGPNYPIMYRIDISLALNETYKERMNTQKPYNKFRNGRSVAESLDYMKNLVAAGVDMIDVDMGCYDNWWLPHPPSSMPSACFLDLSDIVKSYFKENNIKSNKGLEVPICAVGKMGYPDMAEQALRDDKCDMVMLGRPLLADPAWPNKAYAGKVLDIRPCIGCQEGCLNEFVEGGHPQCAVNPRTAFEEEFPEEIQKAQVKKNIAIIGAGPSGITAAAVLAKRGHKVTLFEKDSKIGGQMIPGSQAKIKYEVLNYVTYLENIVKKLEESGKLTLNLNTTVDAKSLKEAKFDSVLVASGSRPRTIKVEGFDNKNVFQAIDVLNKPSLMAPYKNIAVVGGGVVGAETAYMLKYEFNKDTYVVEMDKYIMNHTCTANRGHLIHYLEEAGVKLYNMTTLKKIGKDSITVSRNVDKNVPDPYNSWAPILPENISNPLAKNPKDKFKTLELSCDAVIMAAGSISNNELYYELVKEHVAPEINIIGDAFKGGKVHDATRTAYRKAIVL